MLQLLDILKDELNVKQVILEVGRTDKGKLTVQERNNILDVFLDDEPQNKPDLAVQLWRAYLESASYELS